MASLRLGSRGGDVKRLHELLYEAGAFDTFDKDWTKFSKKTRDAVIYFQQTHQASDGVPLMVDGAVGDNTWWALKHQHGIVQRSFVKPDIPNGISEDRRGYLLVALGEHAKKVRERPNGSNRSKEIDKYFPQWWLDQNTASAKGMAWCCFCVSWCDHEALGYYTLGRRYGSCKQAMNAAIKADLWYQRGDYVPIPGDWFIMQYGGGKGHIGFVLRVSKDGTKMNTIEGNCGNRVKVGLRDIADPIVGFVNPFGDEFIDQKFAYGICKVGSVGKDTTR